MMEEARRQSLSFLPLGGTGEIGMNLNLYKFGDKWLCIDCGIGFGGNDTPGADILVPDPTYIVERRKNLVGMLITHAHEDHIGAIVHLWKKLKCPIYITRFAAAIVRGKLAEERISNVPIYIVEPKSRFHIGPFDIELIPVTHSIPEAQSVFIRTKQGNVLHTGDWKFDPNPVIGEPTDLGYFKKLGDEGVLALVCDSTSIMKEGPSQSETEVQKSLIDLIGSLKGRIAVTCFASNVGRVKSLAIAAQKAGRKVVCIGRSLRRLDNVARECGYFDDIEPFYSEKKVNRIPDHEIMMIITGSQGEKRSALSRIAADTHPSISLGEGDTVIYSSRMIPGNEKAIMAVQDDLARRGVNVITDREHLVHVSGHATGGDVQKMYELTRPHYVVPVHGEWRHLAVQADLAKSNGLHPVLLEDGDVLSMANDNFKIVDSVPTDRLVVDGRRLLAVDSDVMRQRRKMLFDGVVVGSFAIDDEGYVIGAPKVSAPGLFEENEQLCEKTELDFADALDALSESLRVDDDLLYNAAKTALRRILKRHFRKAPIVDIQILHV